MDIQQLLIQLGFIVVLGGVIVGAFELYKYGKVLLKLKIGAARVDQLEAEAARIVQAIQQMGNKFGFDGAKKKELALVALTEVAKRLGIELTDEEKDRIIESLVYILKLEEGTLAPKAPVA